MKKKLFRVLSLFLAVLMISQTLPLAVYALDLRLDRLQEEQNRLLGQMITEDPLTRDEIPVFSNVREDAVIVAELTEKRELNKKYFLMSDRSIQVAVYDQPVHY